jgi:hypothetical protein
MAYKSLESSFIYRELNHDGRLSEQMMGLLQKGEILTKKDLEEQFLMIQKNFKYPLKFKILDEVEKENIILMYAPDNIKIPLAVPFFLTRSKQDKIVAVVCVDLFGSKKANGITVDSKKLYTLMEAAYFAKLCYNYSKQIASRNTVISVGGSIYGNILVRVFNKKYALNIDKLKMNKLIYLANKFYMINLLGLQDNDVTRNYALKACVAANHFSLEEADRIFNPEAYKDISTFILELKNKDLGFNFKDLQVRGFLESYIQMYDASMLLALESFPYFFYNVLSVTNGAFLNSQYVLEDIVGTGGAKIYADLLNIGDN